MAELPIDGAKLKAWRVRRKWSQKKIEQKSGVSQEYISQLETGKRRVLGDVLARKLADALGLKLTAILDKEFVESLTKPADTHAAPHTIEEEEAPYLAIDLPSIMAQPIAILSIPAMRLGRMITLSYVYAPAGEVQGRELRAVRLAGNTYIFDLDLTPEPEDEVVVLTAAGVEVVPYSSMAPTNTRPLGVLVEERRKTGR